VLNKHVVQGFHPKCLQSHISLDRENLQGPQSVRIDPRQDAPPDLWQDFLASSGAARLLGTPRHR
jgi:hypothetical protein